MKQKSSAIEFDAKRFAADITAAREEHGLKLIEVEKLIDAAVSDNHVAKLEQGLEDNPKIKTILALCNLYDIDPRRYFWLVW